jgi:hypothetical protein
VYVPEWFNNKGTFNTADNINIAAGGTITDINAQLALANAAITGTVRFTPTNQPVNGADVVLFRASTGLQVGLPFSTGADGIFTITNVASDVYKVLADNGLTTDIVPEFYQDVPADFNDFQASVAAATAVTLTNNATQSIAMLVDPTAVITGLITDTATSLPLANQLGGPVELRDSGGNFVDSSDTDANGIYEFRGFGSGNYKIRYGVSGYSPEWYDNVPSDIFGGNIALATEISATSGITRVNINAGLTPAGAQITGTVTSVTGTPIANVDVLLFQRNLNTGNFGAIVGANTNASGEYAFSNVIDGDYKVRVGQGDPEIIPHAFEWFNNANVITSATTITVTGGVSQTNKNVQLATGGCLSGKIIDGESGLPTAFPYQVRQQENGNQVIAVIPNGLTSWTTTPFASGGPPPLEQGEFLACGLPSGVYTVDCSAFVSTGQQITATVTAGSVTGGLVCKIGLTKVFLPAIIK